MLDKSKKKPSGPRLYPDLPLHLQHGVARHQDRAAKRQLIKAQEKKAKTEAVLKQLGMELEG
jgi:hypothetical protein